MNSLPTELAIELNNCRQFCFDGQLPGCLKVLLEEYLQVYSNAELIATLQTIRPDVQKEKTESEAYRGNSGYAGEEHMAACMRLA